MVAFTCNSTTRRQRDFCKFKVNLDCTNIIFKKIIRKGKKSILRSRCIATQICTILGT